MIASLEAPVSSDFLKPRQSGSRYPTDFLIGELLVKSGIVSRKDLDGALAQAAGAHLKVGQMLLVARCITPRELQVVLDAQSALRDRVVDINMAIKAIKEACSSGTSFGEAIKIPEPVDTQQSSTTNRLGELLLESGVINNDQLARDLQRSMSTGLPLGRILVLSGSITEAVLSTALEIQVRLRDDMLSRPEALDCLRAAASHTVNQNASEKNQKGQSVLQPPRKHGIRLGELFIRAGILPQSDVMNAVELGLMKEQPVGQILVSQGVISNELLESALKLQELVDQDILDVEQAPNCLKKIHSQGMSFSEAVGEIEANRATKHDTSFQNMLILAKVVSEEDIQKSIDAISTNPEIMAKVLLMTGRLSDAVGWATLACHRMIAGGYLTQEDALVGLDYCLRKMSERPITYEEALKELGLVSGSWKRKEGDVVESAVRISAQQAAMIGNRSGQRIFFAGDNPIALEPTQSPEKEIKVPTDSEQAKSETPEPAPATEASPVTTAPPASATPTTQSTAEPPAPNESASTKKPFFPVDLLETMRRLAGNRKIQETTMDPAAFAKLSQSVTSTGEAPPISSSNNSTTLSDIPIIDGGGLHPLPDDAVPLNKIGNHPVLSGAFSRLAESYCEQGKYDTAEKLYMRALEAREKELGPERPELVVDINNIIDVLCLQNKFIEAQPHAERAVALIEYHEPGENLKLANNLAILAHVYYMQENYEQSEAHLKRALQLKEQTLGKDHLEIAELLRDYAKLLRKTNRPGEAERIYSQARTILAKAKAEYAELESQSNTSDHSKLEVS